MDLLPELIDPAVIVDVYEREGLGWRVAVRHVFYGRTRKQSLAFYRAHLKTDAFLRAAVAGEPLDGLELRAVRVQ